MKNIQQYRNIIIVVVILAISAFISYNIYSDYLEKTKELEKKIKKVEEGKETIKAWEEEMSEYKDLKDSFFEKDMLEIKKFIEDTARSTGITIDSLSQSESQTEYFQVVKFNLDFDCSYRQVTRFVRLLEREAVEITQLLITDVTRKQKKLSVDMSIRSSIPK